jgi:hypothetical protein
MNMFLYLFVYVLDFRDSETPLIVKRTSDLVIDFQEKNNAHGKRLP